VVVGVAVLNLLERHFAAQLLVVGHKHFAQAAAGVRTQDAEPQAAGSGRAHAGGAGGKRVVVVPDGGRDVGQAGLQVGVDDLLQLVADRGQRADGGQALLGIVVVPGQVPRDQGGQQLVLLGRERLVVEQDLADGPRLIEHPVIEGAEQLAAVDEVVLQGQDAEQQVAVAGSVGHGHHLRRNEEGGRNDGRRPPGLVDYPRWDGRGKQNSGERCG
jgi:hypothetical protein